MHALIHHIIQHEDSSIPHDLHFRYRNIVFGIWPMAAPPQPVLTYNDTVAILASFSEKMHREGYQWRFARVYPTHGDGHLGDALISHLVNDIVVT